MDQGEKLDLSLYSQKVEVPQHSTPCIHLNKNSCKNICSNSHYVQVSRGSRLKPAILFSVSMQSTHFPR